MKKLLFFSLLLLTLHTYAIHPELGYRIKLYSLCTPSHEVLRDNYFLPSITNHDDYEVVIESAEQTCASASYFHAGWNKTMLAKVDVIIKAIQENWGKLFIFSDLDIQYFAPTEALLVKLMHGKDIIIQRGGPEGSFCAGFFACLGNKKTLNLWQEIKRQMLANPKLDDQTPLNNLLIRTNPYKISWSLLPVRFYNGGIFTGKNWNPGTPLQIPKNIVLHHACWTIGIPNKVAQLDYIRDVVEKRRIHEKNKQ